MTFVNCSKKVFLSLQVLASSASSDSANEEVIIEKVDDKGIFTMNRSKVLNALSIAMIRKMTACLKVLFCLLFSICSWCHGFKQ